MTVEEKIISHIEQNCTYPDGRPMMDEQTFYEGAKWGYNEAMRWRDPNTDPPINQDVVLVKTDNNFYATAYYHGDASGFITYGEDAYVEFGEIIGWRPIKRLNNHYNKI